MRLIARALLVFTILLGTVFIGQGIGLIPGSFMTGRIEWSVIGAIMDGLAAIGLYLTLR